MENEMRLIDANELLLQNELAKNRSPVFRSYAKVLIDNAPTVDAAPVVHGHWIDKTVWYGRLGHIRTQCSVCKTVYIGKPGSRGDGKGGKFCEECGAKMDLETDHGK